MNIKELKEKIDHTIEAAIEDGYNPDEITVSVQIGYPWDCDVFSTDVELHYDGYLNVEGCCLAGQIHEICLEKDATKPSKEPTNEKI